MSTLNGNNSDHLSDEDMDISNVPTTSSVTETPGNSEFLSLNSQIQTMVNEIIELKEYKSLNSYIATGGLVSFAISAINRI